MWKGPARWVGSDGLHDTASITASSPPIATPFRPSVGRPAAFPTTPRAPIAAERRLAGHAAWSGWHPSHVLQFPPRPVLPPNPLATSTIMALGTPFCTSSAGISGWNATPTLLSGIAQPGTLNPLRPDTSLGRTLQIRDSLPRSPKCPMNAGCCLDAVYLFKITLHMPALPLSNLPEF